MMNLCGGDKETAIWQLILIPNQASPFEIVKPRYQNLDINLEIYT